ncbi:MAG: hypothetical protein GW855_06505 [Erythrobacter sp.]|nr:hypothetical protein [Erythrobacter sp.]NCQ63894.1 hypothetical protein [Alphaproteobacteria bacterium]
MHKVTFASIAALVAVVSVPAMAQTAPAPKIDYVSREMAQQVPQGDAPMTGDLPICKPDQQTNCINSWDVNRTGNRPINYWPGRPASEIEGPLPVDKPNR